MAEVRPIGSAEPSVKLAKLVHYLIYKWKKLPHTNEKSYSKHKWKKLPRTQKEKVTANTNGKSYHQLKTHK